MTALAEYPGLAWFRCTYWFFKGDRAEPDTIRADRAVSEWLAACFSVIFASVGQRNIVSWYDIFHVWLSCSGHCLACWELQSPCYSYFFLLYHIFDASLCLCWANMSQ